VTVSAVTRLKKRQKPSTASAKEIISMPNKRVGPTVVGYGLVTKKRNQPKRMITLFENSG
jgi:hypothetical protein